MTPKYSLKKLVERKNPEGLHPCPKCGSKETLIGNKDHPCVCTDCDHEWKKEPAPVAAENRKVMFKSPLVLLTFNDHKKKRIETIFEKRLNKRLHAILEGGDVSLTDIYGDDFCRMCLGDKLVNNPDYHPSLDNGFQINCPSCSKGRRRPRQKKGLQQGYVPDINIPLKQVPAMLDNVSH